MDRKTARTTLTIGVAGLSAALALTASDACAQGVPPTQPPPPGFEPSVLPAQPSYPPAAQPPPTYYVPPSVAATGPRRIDDWEEGEPIPAGYHKIQRFRTSLIVGGAVTFGVSYLLTALSGAIVHDIGKSNCATVPSTGCSAAKSGALLIIPVGGPFAILSTGSAFGDFFFVFDGLVQAAGLGMFIAGFAAQKTVLVRNDLAKSFEIKPTPMTFGQNSAGFGFVGTF